MLRVSITSAVAHKARLALTSVAVALGVAFVAGAYVFTDTILARFEVIFDEVYAGVDATVRAQAPDFGVDDTTQPAPLPDDVVADVAALDEVAIADGYIQTFGQVVDPEGEPVGGTGAPTFVYSWSGVDETSPFTIADGREPAAPGEMVVDVATAELGDLAVGDTVALQFASGTETFELVGLVSFGSADNLAGATLAGIPLGDAQRILGMAGQVTFIDLVAADGVDQDALVEAVTPVLADGVEVVSADDATTEAVDGFTDGLAFMSVALLAFAGVAVLVAAFLIHNTFRIIVAQRTREMALLRALGASSRQVVAVVLVEALVVGLVASVAGVVAGIGVAELIKAAMHAVGFGPPDGPLTLLPRTVVVALAVGVVVTLLSALVPALRASRVAPVAAMRAPVARARSARPVTVASRIGAVVAGVAGVAVGLAVDEVVLTAAGAAVGVVGVLLLAPSFTRPIASVLGRLAPGASGLLARENVAREPRRTAATASALTVGLALVVLTAVFAASTTASVEAATERSLAAELSVRPTNPFTPVSQDAVAAVAALSEVAAASPLRSGPARVDGQEVGVAAVDPATVGELYEPVGSDADLADLGEGLLVDASVLEDRGWAIGDGVTVEFPSGTAADLVVAGTHEDALLGGYVVAEPVWQHLGGGTDASAVLVGLADGVTTEAGREAVEEVLEAYPSLAVSTRAEQITAAAAQIDALLVLFTALLALALLIAVLGIANTLGLSIVERTREIGLLRAVGMSRGQVRRMIVGESLVTALFGALLGTTLGLALGWVLVTALADRGLSELSVPIGQVVTWVVVAAVAGVLAALLPARRAARLDVLRAIAME